MSVQLSIFRLSRNWLADNLNPDSEITDTFDRELDFRSGRATLLTPDGLSVTGLARGGPRGRASSFDQNVSFTYISSIDPISISDLISAIRSPSRSAAKDRLRRGYGLLSQTASTDVRTWLLEQRPDAGQVLEAILNLPPDWLTSGSEAADVYRMEQDSVNLALNIGGFDRGGALDGAVRPAGPAHFALSSSVVPDEDSTAIDDLSIFPGWERIRSLRPAGRVFEEPGSGRRLTVLHANKNQIEHTTGVDLVYYIHEFSSFVLVQYKRVRAEGKNKLVRVDSQFCDELDRMRNLEDKHRTTTASGRLVDHRLSDATCFFKMCDFEQEMEIEDLARGQYLDLGTWDALDNDGALSGPQGGKRYLYASADRYFSNTEFTHLAAGGWIGSRATQSEALLDYIFQGHEAGKALILGSLHIGHAPRRATRHAQHVVSRPVRTA